MFLEGMLVFGVLGYSGNRNIARISLNQLYSEENVDFRTSLQV